MPSTSACATKGCPTPPRPTDPVKLPLLYSYAYLRKWPAERLAKLLSDDRVEVIMDSGAFTAKNIGEDISLDEYVTFLHEWKHRLFGYIALDVLQDPDATDRNLNVMLAEGLKPIPVHVYGDDKDRMDHLFSLSDWVALGGLRRPHRGAAPDSYVKQKMEWAAGRNVHWLGYTKLDRIMAYTPYSCDTASWSAGMQYGAPDLYMGKGKFKRFNFREWCEKKMYLRGDYLARLRRYGIPVEMSLDPRYWKNGNKKHELKSIDCFVVRLPARSWCDYVLDVRERYGTRLFIAVGGEKTYTDVMMDAFVDVVKARKGGS